MQKNNKPLKVLALISGGKDSIFNIVKCLQDGHQVVALGNLYNAEQGTQLDSYMYQTVGSNMSIPIAEAMQKPLFRRKIQGKPKILTMQYQGDKNGDQVEDLYDLVKEVKEKYPQINAISSGAIFSTYQKLRVEDVCNRFQMISLAYLWHRDQTQLIKEMVDYPLNAIIMKVASYGLNKKHLGRTIQELIPTFMKLKEECGMNVCGQGGEFQSLVLDCPIYRKRIVIDEMQIVQVDKNQLAPVAYLLINTFHLEDK